MTRFWRWLTKSQGFAAIHQIMANHIPNFRLQFLDLDGGVMLAERTLSATDADDRAGGGIRTLTYGRLALSRHQP
jgi:hypothetical protein